MSAEIVDSEKGILTVRVSGTLTHAELSALQRAAADLIEKQGKVRILVLTEAFEGWRKDEGWGDLTFQLKHDEDIEKMAIVGDRKWEDLTLIFTAKGLRKFPIEYFESKELAKARAWLASTKA